jgi:tetratricopeptide (TPR) repeat protein
VLHRPFDAFTQALIMSHPSPVASPPRRPVWVLRLIPAALVLGLLATGGYWWQRQSLQSAIKQCQAALLARRWDDARYWADQWTQLRPADASGWFARAEAARQQKDWTATEESLARVPVNDARYLRSQAMRADLVLEELRDPHRSIQIWNDLLKIAPSSDRAHQRLIYLYAMTLQRSAMGEQIRKAIRVRAEPPEAYGYLMAMNALVFSDGFPRVSQWLRQHPDDETLRVAQAVFAARTNPSKGQRMFGVGDGLTANLYLIEKCRADYPHNLEVLSYFLEAAIGQAEFSRVGELLQGLPATAETDSRFWRYRGTWLDSQRRPAEAAEAFRKAIELYPLDWRSHHELGIVARVLQQPDLAARHAELGQRGKQLERRILELPNAAQADEPLMRELFQYALDCGDSDMAQGLDFRLN